MNSEPLRPIVHGGRKPLGKLASRLDELKNPWRQGSTLELSHSEAARLATDALLEGGEKEYRRVLLEERELSFLSPLEIAYITEQANRTGTGGLGATDSGAGDYSEGGGDAASELTSGTYFPMMSDEEPPMLELGWPDLPSRYGPSETQIHFQRDKTHNLKDLIRSLINKAKKVIALVMDLFTDVDLLCDLMEASNKRRVPVYILLDDKNLGHFIDMCKALNIDNSHLGLMRIRSVCGDTYCTKSGKKFNGQVQEKFLIIDCEEVITGSYSFTWLSAQVHSNMVLHFSGRILESFDREFRCMYADSQEVNFFHNPEEDGLPVYPFAMMAPSMGFDVPFKEKAQERTFSENSSSQSSGSVSSIKKAPGTVVPAYKVSYERKDPVSTERRSGQNQHQVDVGLGVEHGMLGQGTGAEWCKVSNPDPYRSNLGGATSKIKALGLYDQKQAPFQGGIKSPPFPDTKLTNKNRSASNPFLNKITELFNSPGKDKDLHNFRKSPPQSAAFGGPDLSQTEPESKQPVPIPAPIPLALATEGALADRRLNRHDNKRMTLGHSKLDLVNQYNQMKSKQIYSRFEMKNNH